jgi:hypothetical protein
MDETDLAEWASEDRPELTEAVAADIRDHFRAIPARGDVYGYAILPGDPSTSANGISSLTAAYRRASEINVSPDERQFVYFKYSVDEWGHWDHDKFRRSDAVLASLNAQFDAAHQKDPDDFAIDEYRGAYSESLLNAILEGIAKVKAEGLFGREVEYLVLWISDSDNPIRGRSVRLLSSPEVVEEFLGEFGG